MKWKLLRQILIMSKYTFYGILIQTILCSFLFSRDLSGQHKPLNQIYISLENENASLKELFASITAQTDLYFTYNSEKVDDDQKVKYYVSRNSLNDILRDLSKKYQLGFKRVNDHIFVNKRSLSKKSVEDVIDFKNIAQQKVSGTVTSAEDGEFLPGVSILVKGTTLGTTTNLEGKFMLEAPENSILQFSYIGFETQEVELGNQTLLNVSLQPDLAQLEEVVVVGYGSQKKTDLTGAVSSIKNEVFEENPVNSLEQALQGQSSGVFVSSQSGAPGNSLSIKIRGVNSINSSSDPLYVVDGMPIMTQGVDNISPLSTINPNDIENIEILKDASSCAIYGSRGANGVVLITTKRGKTGKAKVNFNTSYGFQKIGNTIDLLNGQEYMDRLDQVVQLPSNNINPVDWDNLSFPISNTDWMEDVTRTAPISNNQLSISGGNENTKYYFSGNYFNQQGIIKDSYFKRGSVRLNLEQKINDKLKINTDLSASRATPQGITNNSEHGVKSYAFHMPPVIPAGKVNGSYVNPGEIISGDPQFNPFGYLEGYQYKQTQDRLLGNAKVSYKIIDGLKLDVLFGVDHFIQKLNVYRASNVDGKVYNPSNNGDAHIRNSIRTNFLNSNILTYEKKFDRHAFTVTGVYEWQKVNSTFDEIRMENFSSDKLGFNAIEGGNFQTASSGAFNVGLVSYLGRVNYIYNDKYLITASVRRDGSSKFGPENKWGTFPSAAVAWRISEENFMKNDPIISNLKLRLSWGVNGNSAIRHDIAFATTSNFQVRYSSVGGIDNIVGVATNTRGNDMLPNKEIKWEKTEQVNVGVDFGMFDNRLSFVADYFVSNTNDLIMNKLVPLTTGFGNIQSNVGELSNKGLELALNAVVIDNAFKWNVNLNYTRLKNEIVDLGENDELQYSLGGINSILKVGESIGSLYGYKHGGIIQNESEFDQPDMQHLDPGTYDPGHIKYVDINNDSLLNSADYVKIGNMQPDFYFGITNNFSFKGFELRAVMQGVFGNNIVNPGVGNVIDGIWGNMHREFWENRWTGEGSTNWYPGVVSRNGLNQFSEFNVYEGSYFRLKTLTLSYDLGNHLKFIDRARLYFTGTNLLTFSSYQKYGYDPDINIGGEYGTYHQEPEQVNPRNSSNIWQGFDNRGSYPSAKTYILGLNITF